MGEAEKLHNEALATFITQNYDQCIANLHKIVKVDEKRKNDPRVQHNLAIAEFFKGGCVETEKLTQDLKSLTKLDTKTKTKVDGKVKVHLLAGSLRHSSAFCILCNLSPRHSGKQFPLV